MSFVSGVARAATKILPIAGKAIGSLPVVGGIVRGIGSIFGGRTQRGAEKIAGGMDRAYQGARNFQSQAPQFRDQALDMAGRGMSAFNEGQRMWGQGQQMVSGMRDSLQRGDYGGAMNQFGSGMRDMVSGGQRMYGHMQSMYDTGRQMVNGMQGLMKRSRPNEPLGGRGPSPFSRMRLY